MAVALDAKARHALTACRILRSVGAFGLMLLALKIFSTCALGMSVRLMVEMLQTYREGNLVAFLIGAVGTVLMQSPAQAILIAGQMVASSQIDAQIGIILTIGTSIGATIAPLLLAAMPRQWLHLTRAVWGISAYQILKLMACGSCALLLVPAEILSRGKLLGFTSTLVDSMASIHLTYIDPSSWVVQPVADRVVRIQEWRLKAYILGPPAVLPATGVSCITGDLHELAAAGNGCTYSCLPEPVQRAWHALNPGYYSQLNICANALNSTVCDGDHSSCLLSSTTFWKLNVEDERILEEGGVISGLICSLVFLYMASRLFQMADLRCLGRCRIVLEKALTIPGPLASFGIMLFSLLLMHDSTSIVCILTPLCGIGYLPPAKMMYLCIAAEIGSALALIAASTGELPYSKGIIQLGWVWLLCSILTMFFTALPCVRRVALHSGLMCAAAVNEYSLVYFVLLLSLPLALAGTFALLSLWDASSVFTICILLVVLPILVSTAAWCFWRSEWLLPFDVREKVREQCESALEDTASTRPVTEASPAVSPSFLPMSPTVIVHPPEPASALSAETHRAERTPSPTNSSIPNLEMISEDEGARFHGPRIPTPMPVMPVVPRSNRPSLGSDSSISSFDVRRNLAQHGDFSPFPYDVTTMPGGPSSCQRTPARPELPDIDPEPRHLSEGAGHAGHGSYSGEDLEAVTDSQGTRQPESRYAISASPEQERTTWSSSLQVLTSRLRMTSTPLSSKGSEESC